jgi:hypothetical protein
MMDPLMMDPLSLCLSPGGAVYRCCSGVALISEEEEEEEEEEEGKERRDLLCGRGGVYSIDYILIVIWKNEVGGEGEGREREIEREKVSRNCLLPEGKGGGQGV